MPYEKGYRIEPEIIRASDLRTEITGLTHPERGRMYLVVKRGRPVFLIWPVIDLESDPARQRHTLMAIKARNTIPDLAIIEEVSALTPRVTMTELRRGVTGFLRRIALSPYPGLVTHYDVVVAIYVPLYGIGQARQFTKALNTLVG